MIRKILITGSQGYIGSCAFEILKKKYQVFGVDKNKVKELNKQKNFYKLDLLDYKKTFLLIQKINPDLVIHLAGESTIDNISKKKKYIDNNVEVTKNLIKAINQLKIANIIFSSTAAVYGKNLNIITENSKLKPSNIYGKTKLKCEDLIKKEIDHKYSNYIIFRFFNVCSSLKKEKVGEGHSPETHLIPIMINKILKSKLVKIYGNKFNTSDGTCIRDYVHIRDIITGFQKAIKFLDKDQKSDIFNLGTGKGFSVLTMVKSLNSIFHNKQVKYLILKKRKGDVSKLVCSFKKAKKKLSWYPKHSEVKKILLDEIYWQKLNYKNFINRKFKY